MCTPVVSAFSNVSRVDISVRPSMMCFRFISGKISNLAKKSAPKIAYEVSAIRNFHVNLFARPINIKQVHLPYVSLFCCHLLL